jgi:heme-degrading monooxygenase HmoA
MRKEDIMAYMLGRIKVRDYAFWRTIYDANEGYRKASGSIGARIFRNADNPHEIIVLFELADLDAARKFAKSDELKRTMQKSGVVDRPDFYFLEEAEASPS